MTPVGRANAANAGPVNVHKKRAGSGRGGIEVAVLTAVLSVILWLAWISSDERHMIPASGIGYYLGIIGSVMMLVMLIYPLRKRIPALRWIGQVPAWFRAHMLLGILGPALVVLHSNFSLGSLNSRVALFAMLLVSGSGYIGRFLYLKTHRGLNGRKSALLDLQAAAAEDLASDDLQRADVAILESYQLRRIPERSKLVPATWNFFTGPASRDRIKRRLLKGHGSILVQSTGATTRTDHFLKAIAKAEAFVFYERLFALWHLLHFPLFVILVLAAILHVIAVHLF